MAAGSIFDCSGTPPGFGDDFFWWASTHANHPPPECLGKFVLIYNRKIRHIATTEEGCLHAMEAMGLSGRHFVIMAVGVRPQRDGLEIPI